MTNSLCMLPDLSFVLFTTLCFKVAELKHRKAASKLKGYSRL